LDYTGKYVLTGSLAPPFYRLLHREITHPASDKVVDHWNRNPLDNRDENLRNVSQHVNMGNVYTRNKSGIRGLTKDNKSYTARYIDANHAVQRQSFNIDGFGDEIARNMAITALYEAHKLYYTEVKAPPLNFEPQRFAWPSEYFDSTQFISPLQIPAFEVYDEDKWFSTPAPSIAVAPQPSKKRRVIYLDD
jgi:hypothetical protein